METVQNPVENSESEFLSTDSSATTRRRRERMTTKGVHKYTSKRIDYEEKQDPDIQREIDRHGSDNVRIHT